MTPRQVYALTHPLNEANPGEWGIGRYTKTRRHATGLLLLTILAVDR